MWYIFVSMNFRVIAMDELKDVFLKLENYSLTEVLYAALNKIVKNEREEDEKN